MRHMSETLFGRTRCQIAYFLLSSVKQNLRRKDREIWYIFISCVRLWAPLFFTKFSWMQIWNQRIYTIEGFWWCSVTPSLSYNNVLPVFFIFAILLIFVNLYPRMSTERINYCNAEVRWWSCSHSEDYPTKLLLQWKWVLSETDSASYYSVNSSGHQINECLIW